MTKSKGINPQQEKSLEAERDKALVDRVVSGLAGSGMPGGAWAPPHVTARKTPKGNPTTSWRSF